MKFNKQYIIFTLLTSLLAFSCNDSYLDALPETQISKENFFRTEEDLNLYILNLYNYSSSGIYEADATTDNASTTGNNEIKNMMNSTPSSTTITSGWDWSQLRKINFFLENFKNANLPEATLNHYEGLARYFRARFYAEKVNRYSDVPWIDVVITTDNEELLKAPRDKRELVVDKILEDFEFASQNVREASLSGSPNQWVVKTEFARFALNEGTYRRYHEELGLQPTATIFLEKATQLSQGIMDSKNFSIYSTGKPLEDYGTLFYSQNLDNNKEVIMARNYENEVLNGSNWPGMFGNYEYYPLKDLVQSYLMNDGTFYTAQANYQTKSFVDEFKNRDPRIYQSYAYPGWNLIYTSTYTQGGGIYVQQLAKNFSGYHQIKGFLNTLDIAAQSGTDIPLYRYAEVLLIFAEAKAELGTLTQGDLDKTINILRDRVGMPHMSLSQAIDPIQAAKYSNVTGAQKNLILEIRRERRVELAFEGFRFNDLMRWKAGKLLEKNPEGIYFSSLGKHDLTGDGIADIVLLPASATIPEVKETNELGVALRYYRVGTFGQDVSVFLKNGNQGNVQVIEDTGSFIEPKYYYRPIPQSETFLNPNLNQIFDWN